MPTPSSFCRDKFSTVITLEKILVDHIDGTLCSVPDKWTHARMATRLLIDRKMLELVRDGSCTKITERGRDALAGLLGEHAERLLDAERAVIEAALAPQPQRRYPWGYGPISRKAETDAAPLAGLENRIVADREDQTLPT